MALVYRRMEPADIPACAHELIAAFREEPWNETWTYGQAYDRIDEIMSGRVSRGYVCMDGDQCAAMLCGRIMTYQDVKQLFIDEFSVHPAWQRQGVGSRLLAFMRDEMKREPVPVRHLCLITERGYPAVTFYERNGFVILPDSLFMAAHVQWP